MSVVLDPATEQRIARELARGVYRSPDELVSHALELLTAEEDWLLRHRDAINADLDESFAQQEHGAEHSPEEARMLLTRRRSARAV